MYKYCPISKYSVEIITKNNIFFNHINKMNDSAEGFCHVESGFPKFNDKNERYKRIIQIWYGESGGNPSRYEYDEYIDSMREIEPNVNDIINSSRISCFTKTPLNPTMWAHYANSMTGICLEFDEEKMSELEEVYIFEVDYLATPSTIDSAIITLLNDQIEYNAAALQKGYMDGCEHLYEDGFRKCQSLKFNIFKNMLATKSKEWSYEQEKRMVYHLSLKQVDQRAKESEGGITLSLPKNSLKNVILGEKTSEKDKGVIIRAIKKSESCIGLKRIVRKPNEYSLTLIDEKFD